MHSIYSLWIFVLLTTGMQHGVITASHPYGLPLKFKLLPEYLHDLGYETRAVGKWHLGYFRHDYMPTNRGFLTHFGYMLGKQDYYDHTDFCKVACIIMQMAIDTGRLRLTNVTQLFSKAGDTIFAAG